MDTASITLGLSNIFVASLFILMGIPLVKRKVPMNSLYGVRIKKAYKSEEIWYALNAYGGKQLIIWSIPILLLGIGIFFIPLEEDSPLAGAFACAPLIVLVPAAVIFMHARKL